jgi:hypothetical protein
MMRGDTLGSRRDGFLGAKKDALMPSIPCLVFIRRPMTVLEPQE